MGEPRLCRGVPLPLRVSRLPRSIVAASRVPGPRARGRGRGLHRPPPLAQRSLQWYQGGTALVPFPLSPFPSRLPGSGPSDVRSVSAPGDSVLYARSRDRSRFRPGLAAGRLRSLKTAIPVPPDRGKRWATNWRVRHPLKPVERLVKHTPSHGASGRASHGSLFLFLFSVPVLVGECEGCSTCPPVRSRAPVALPERSGHGRPWISAW